jgi:hypothetical protein
MIESFLRAVVFEAETCHNSLTDPSHFDNDPCLFPYVGTLTSIFEDKMSLKIHKTIEIKVYLNFFACWWKDPDPFPDPDPDPR